MREKERIGLTKQMIQRMEFGIGLQEVVIPNRKSLCSESLNFVVAIMVMVIMVRSRTEHKAAKTSTGASIRIRGDGNHTVQG